MIHLQDVFHVGYKLGIFLRGNDPTFVKMGFESAIPVLMRRG
jgi:hypothetical protein